MNPMELNPMERIEELASRYVLGLLTPSELGELEDTLGASDEARSFFAEFCMDEVLLGGVLASGAAAPAADLRPRPAPASPWRKLAAAAALVAAFVGGFAAATLSGRERRPDEQSARLASSALPGDAERGDPLPIYYPRAHPASADAEPESSVRLLVHPLDFDESGALSTNPYLKVVPLEVTEL